MDETKFQIGDYAIHRGGDPIDGEVFEVIVENGIEYIALAPARRGAGTTYDLEADDFDRVEGMGNHVRPMSFDQPVDYMRRAHAIIDDESNQTSTASMLRAVWAVVVERDKAIDELKRKVGP